MKNKENFPFLWIFAVLLLAMSIPRPMVEKIQGGTIASFSPFWEGILESKLWAESLTSLGKGESQSEILQLKIENQLLKNELQSREELIEEFFSWNAPQDLHIDHKNSDVLEKTTATVAKVICRPATTWNSSLWVNVGEETNKASGKKLIAKGGAVVVGNSLVGVVDYVGKNQSRICLITDPGLIPSVRAVRGNLQKRYFSESIIRLQDYLSQGDALFSSPEEKELLLSKLDHVRHKLLEEESSHFLAKGELHGASAPIWRSSGVLLKGIGFNCDYADEYGPARDLRRGTPYGKQQNSSFQLLLPHDLLVTTGMDGVFPPGLNVAEVVQVNPLKEGDYFYELSANPTAGNLDDLSLVFILPPYGYDPQDQPTL